MLVARRLAALLGFGALLLLLTSIPLSRQGHQTSSSAAYAQGGPAPAPIEFSLPPPRITPPALLLLSAPRPAPGAVVRSAAASPPVEDMGGSPAPPSRRASRPGLFT